MSVVLVAEDDPDVRALIVLKLDHSGHQVIAVEDGRAALTAATARLPDLVVLDVTLPGMSGLEVCRRLRAEPATARLPIVLVTARAHESDVDAGFLAGADDYVIKPFSPSDLITRLEALLTKRPAT
jgi:two-component system phosphate regulon response regulator PhoB